MTDLSLTLFDKIYDKFPDRSVTLEKLRSALNENSCDKGFEKLEPCLSITTIDRRTIGKFRIPFGRRQTYHITEYVVDLFHGIQKNNSLSDLVNFGALDVDFDLYQCIKLVQQSPSRRSIDTDTINLSSIVSFLALSNNIGAFRKVAERISFFAIKGWLNQTPYATQFLILKIACNFIGVKTIKWPKSSSTQPLLNEIYQHWDTKDLKLIQSLLIKLCNYHTYQTRKVNDEIVDITQFWQYHLPYEILFILRLRQWKGLQLPALDHPLMESPFHQLPEKIDITPDPLIDQVRKKFIELFPDFTDVMGSVDEEVTNLLTESKKAPPRHTPVKSKEAILSEWLNRQPDVSGEPDEGTLSIVSNLLLPHEADELLRVLAVGHQSKHVFKDTPYEQFMRVWDADNPLIPSSFISDWAKARSWALDLYEKSDSLFKFICQRAESLNISDGLEPNALFNQLDQSKPWDYTEFHEYCDQLLEKANATLQTTGLRVVQLEMGRSEYTIFITTSPKADQLPKVMNVDGIEVHVR